MGLNEVMAMTVPCVYPSEASSKERMAILSVYFFMPQSELCHEFMVSFTLRISQKNRRKADISIFILHIGKQNEEKSRDFKMFSLLPFTAFAVLFSGNVFSPLSFPLKLLFILLNQLFAGTCPLLCALTAIPVFSVVQYLSYFAVINH